jgi:secondary thiamine-phosphate synthase enzyme
MAQHTHTLSFATRGFSDAHDLTPHLGGLLKESGLREGSVLLFVPGSTAGLTTIEFESGALADLKAAIERIAPEDAHYDHDARWGDGNGFSHVRAALLKPNLEIPVTGGRLTLGTWQQVVLLDFDNGPRQRKVVCQLRGEFTKA